MTLGREIEVAMVPTLEVALGPEVADGETKDGQSVELGQDVLLEGEKVGESVQLRVEALPVPLAGVALGDTVLRRRLQAEDIPNKP